jgi:hypothetical protein
MRIHPKSTISEAPRHSISVPNLTPSNVGHSASEGKHISIDELIGVYLFKF